MTYFWCSYHEDVHAKGEDVRECLLVGPFPSYAEAGAWPASSESEQTEAFHRLLQDEGEAYEGPERPTEKVESMTDENGHTWTLQELLADLDGGEYLYLTPKMCADLAALLRSASGALHASAPEGHKCSDCTMDSEPCPQCYEAWWRKRHPNVVFTLSSTAKKEER